MSDTLTLSREVVQQWHYKCVDIIGDSMQDNIWISEMRSELEAALAAPQPDLIPQDDLFVCGQMGANVTKVYAEPQPVKQAPKIEVGPKLFSFRSRVDWSNKAKDKWKAHGLTAQKTLCIDQKGRVCGWGEHFITAEDEAAYPIDVYLLRADMAPEIEGAKP